MITVMGATGQGGSETVRRLIAAGETVRALGRASDRLEPLAQAGAATAVGDPADEDFLTEAFTGADALQVSYSRSTRRNATTRRRDSGRVRRSCTTSNVGSGRWPTRELLGPRLLSYAEATAILGEALGLPQLAYVRLPAAEPAAMFREAGFAEPQATLQAVLGDGWSDGTVAAREQRSARNTTTTTFEEYAARPAG